LEAWEEIAVMLMDKNKFTFSSRFEASMAAALDIMGIKFSYKNLQFYINSADEAITYTPDFTLEVTRDSKPVIIETHGKRYLDKRFIGKMHSFMESSASKEYYTIIIMDKKPKKPDKLKIELKKYGYEAEDICNEVWRIPYNAELGIQLSIKNDEGSLYTKLNSLRRGENTSKYKVSIEPRKESMHMKHLSMVY
jgi:hypothetical protein